ncbi:MAG: hypothetical protein KAT68_03195 [Bacteroidales bacterium]|nr:hypothetical protein [Bacteroidales bacterium]
MINKIQKLFFLIFVLVINFTVLKGQQSNTMYYMHRLPQSNWLNPAFQDECKLFIGLPVLSSIYLNISNTFLSYNQFVKKSMDPDLLLKKLHRIDYISTELHLNLLSIGYNYDKFYFTFNIAEKNNIDIGFPKDIIGLAWNGNDYFLQKNKKARLDRLGVNFIHYREFALGASMIKDEYLTIGVKGKLLFGKLNLNTKKSDLFLLTDDNTMYLTIQSDAILNASLPIIVNPNLTDFSYDDSQSIKGLILNRKNWGVAFDLGAIYKYDDYFTYYASIIDLGFIRWRSNLNNVTQDGKFTFRGIEGEDAINDINNYFTEIADTFLTEFQYDPAIKKAYFYWMPTQLYLGSTYSLNRKINFGALTKIKVFQKRILPSFTLSANTNIFRFLSTSVSYSILNNIYNNVGLGLGFRGKIAQFYIVSDNVTGMIWPLSTRSLNIRFGFNLFFGCDHKEKCPRKPGCIWIKEMEQKLELREERKKQNEKEKKKFIFFKK